MFPHSTKKFNLRSRIIGVDQEVPLIDGRHVPYINLDNGASTPSFTDVLDIINKFMLYYSSVHRGTGFKSLIVSLFLQIQ